MERLLFLAFCVTSALIASAVSADAYPNFDLSTKSATISPLDSDTNSEQDRAG